MHKVDLNIRAAAPEDAPVLARIHVDSWNAAYQGLVPDAFLANFSYARREEAFRQAISAKSEEIYLAEYQDEPVGILTIGICRDTDLDRQTTAELWGIYLLPSVWRLGIGKRLVEIAEEILANRGYSQIVLWIFEGNSNARRFYEAVGFDPDGARMTRDFGIPLDIIRYKKIL